MKELFKNKPQKVVFWAGFFVVLLLTIAGVGVKLVNKSGVQKSSNVVATVGTKKLTIQDLNKRIYSRDLNGTPDKPTEISEAEKLIFLEELVESELIAQEAAKKGVTVSESEIDELEKSLR